MSGIPIYLLPSITDMRLGSQALAYLVQEQLGMDVFGKSIFLFCGGRGRIVKALVWDKGFLLLHKRLCEGTFRWPRDEGEARLISREDVLRMLSGEDVFRRIPIQEGRYEF
jgi:transposase